MRGPLLILISVSLRHVVNLCLQRSQHLHMGHKRLQKNWKSFLVSVSQFMYLGR